MTDYNLNDIEKMADERNLEGLTQALRNKDRADIRKAAVEARAKLCDPQATPLLVSMISDPDAGVRNAAVQALQQIGDPSQAEKPLRAAFNSKDGDVRLAAFQALTGIMARTGGTPASAPESLPKRASATNLLKTFKPRLIFFLIGAVVWIIPAGFLAAAFQLGTPIVDQEIKLEGVSGILLVIALVLVFVAAILSFRGWSWLSQYPFGSFGSFIKFMVYMFLWIIPVMFLAGALSSTAEMSSQLAEFVPGFAMLVLFIYWTGKGVYGQENARYLLERARQTV